MATDQIRKVLIASAFLAACTFSVLAQRGDPTQQRIVYSLPNTDKVVLRADTVYKTVGDVQLRLDAYYPPTLKNDDRLPVVIFIDGVGNRDNSPKFKTWGQYTNWARLVAASGLAAINYDSRTAETEADSISLLEYVRANAAKLNINENKIVIWACSANGQVGTKLAFEDRPYINAAVFYYSVVNLPPLLRDVPLFIARAGLEREPESGCGCACAAGGTDFFVWFRFCFVFLSGWSLSGSEELDPRTHTNQKTKEHESHSTVSPAESRVTPTPGLSQV